MNSLWPVAISSVLIFVVPLHAETKYNPAAAAKSAGKKAASSKSARSQKKVANQQEPAPSLSLEKTNATALSWQDCLKEMAQNNSDLRVSTSLLRASQESVRAARSGYFPQISASLGYSQSDTTTTSSTASTTNASGATVSTALNLTQNLFSGLSDYEKVQAAQRQVKLAELNLQIAKAKAVLDLRTAYVGLVHARKLGELNDYIIRRRSDNLSMVELRFESGRENKGALLLSQAYLEQAKFERFQAGNAERVAAEQLAKALGREPGTSVAVSTEIPAESVGSEPSLENLAIDVPEYQISRVQEELAQISLRQTRSGFLPTLNLNGSVFGSGPDVQNQSNHWSAGLALTLPLFNGGKDFYSNSAASSNLQSAMFNQRSVGRATIVKLRQTYVTWIEAAEQSRITQSYLTAHKVRATIARDKYNNGLLTFDQWDAVENDLIKIEKDFLNGLKTRWIAEATWKQVQGFSETALDEALK